MKTINLLSILFFAFSLNVSWAYTAKGAGFKRDKSLCNGALGKSHLNGGGFVAKTATVAKSAFVGKNAQVCGNAYVFGNAKVYGSAKISEGVFNSGRHNK